MLPGLAGQCSQDTLSRGLHLWLADAHAHPSPLPSPSLPLPWSPPPTHVSGALQGPRLGAPPCAVRTGNGRSDESNLTQHPQDCRCVTADRLREGGGEMALIAAFQPILLNSSFPDCSAHSEARNHTSRQLVPEPGVAVGGEGGMGNPEVRPAGLVKNSHLSGYGKVRASLSSLSSPAKGSTA